MAIFLSGCAGCAALRGYATARTAAQPNLQSAHWSEAQWGLFAVQHGDFGMLSTDNLTNNAVPYKLLRVLPDVVPEAFFAVESAPWRPNRSAPLARFGYVYVRDSNDASDPEDAVGQVRGMAHRTWPDVTLELVANNCSACHAGRSWDAQGMPVDAPVWGIPNHAIDFDGLVRAVLRAMNDPRASDAALLTAMQARFPRMAQEELRTYERLLLPRFRAALRERTALWGSVHPWQFGGPGMSHGVAVLRDVVDSKPLQRTPAEYPAAFTKIPAVYVSAERQRILIDASYVATDAQLPPFVANMVGFLPVLGTPPADALQQADTLRQVAAFVATLRPPAFPGHIDAAAAQRGAVLYADHCVDCHGRKDANGACHPGAEPVALSVIETDATRATADNAATVRAFNATAVGKVMRVEPSGGYQPPSLCGVWANAPYLHNGSVPTLWHMLHPKARPVRFWVGGHRLDLDKVGIAGRLDASGTWRDDSGYLPWSEPHLVDTRTPGRSNAGHTKQVSTLTEAEKCDLIAFLKTL